MKEKIMSETQQFSPSFEEVLKTVLEILEMNLEENGIHPCFSSPIEVDDPCKNCGNNFITELYALGAFACLECGRLLESQ
ncbi:MAG: hypothetical protein D6732_28980 [Methanobacteriota archaeon]|nr:MAG: hypothetical protein D6732_28980 [Euryarchaeota archaeon]